MRDQRQDETKREKERIADTKSRRAQRQDKTKREQERADDRMRRTAKRANVAINPRAGLNSGLTLSGHFKVEKHSLGLMDKVKISKSDDNLSIILSQGVCRVRSTAFRKRDWWQDVLHGWQGGVATLQETD